MGKDSKGKRGGMYVYTVACVGLIRTTYQTIRMRADNLTDSAKRIARQQVPGMVAYSVVAVEEE